MEMLSMATNLVSLLVLHAHSPNGTAHSTWRKYLEQHTNAAGWRAMTKQGAFPS
jgi:hypothetical protein